MSIDGSRPEYLYSIYLKKNSEGLSRKIGSILNEDDIMLERVYKNERYKRKIDISSIDESGRRVFCEIQLSKSDDKHYMQIIGIIDLAKDDESTVIIWMATGFSSEYIEKLMQLIIYNREKNIELIFLKINQDVIDLLVEVNQHEQIQQLKMLNTLNDIEEHFILIKGIKSYNGNKIYNANELQETYTYKEKLLIKIVKLLRKDSVDYGNVYQYKDVRRKFFSMGTGYGGVDFKIITDKKNRIGIILAFTNVKSKKVYYKLKEKNIKVDDEFNFMLTWNDEYHQISTFLSLGWFNDKEKMVLIFGRIVKKYIYGFDKYLKEAIEEVKDIECIKPEIS